MSKTSAAAKNKWNAAHYSRIQILLDKDLVDQWKKQLEKDGISQASFLREAIYKYLGKAE